MLKYLLLPFSVLYALVLKVRHALYDAGLLAAQSFEKPVIVIGNLSLGGTGKSPLTLYLAGLLKKHRPAILSRGYKRRTRGFAEVVDCADYKLFGDEPAMFKYLHPEYDVFVCENRPEGISKILDLGRGNGVVLLDDAFQHRALKPGLSILLFDYSDVEKGDLLFPAGRRRDLWERYKKADIILLTRCPKNPSHEVQNSFKDKQVFTSRLIYKELRNLKNEHISVGELEGKKIYLLTGIARPEGLVEYLKSLGAEVFHEKFPDHHTFGEAELKKIQENMVKFAASGGYSITTLKDLIRLKSLQDKEMSHKWFYIQPEVEIDEAQQFNKLLEEYVESGKGNSTLH
jgi:tetraacyldisaccharide 4'-kinase